MKVLLGCDVDPILPPRLAQPPPYDIWEPLNQITDLLRVMGGDLPPITWLIRSDESVRFCTGDYASGFLSRKALWSELVARGHELGWHMHLFSYDASYGAFLFDGCPPWLGAAHAALAANYDVRATRTGWDYGSDFLFGELAKLGIEIDFSALPGNRVWQRFGPSTVHVDWLRCPEHPYRPSATDYQRPGDDGLPMVQVPIAQFRNSLPGLIKRYAWRLRNGCFTLRGLDRKTRLVTDHWFGLPTTHRDVWAFFFHPENLTPEGIREFSRNVARLREESAAEFVTASSLARWLESQTPR
jgi:hypothetical protein